MTCYSQNFKSFALSEMAVRPSVIKQWAEQTEDKELKELAKSVIEAAGQTEK